ncbi:MAG: hypothetical protein IT334_11445 [Thermomicrobiales bacterium]|nr:hypothetical protein [Thermomicrobiales bacterium]
MVDAAIDARVAAFDIGSNSIKLTVAEVAADGNVAELWSDIATVRLGQDVDRTRRLADDRIEAAFEALARLSEAARSAGALKQIGVATEAVRIATNGPAFLDDVRARFGIDVVRISGEREAELTYAGLATIRSLHGPVLMVDIGGASTEIVAGDGSTIIEAVSLPLGSGRLTDTWIENDPPTWAEIAAARVAAADRLAPLRLDRHAGARLIVSGGTGGYLTTYLSGQTDLTVPEIDAALAGMRRLPAVELAPLIKAPVERARILPAGVAIILAVADRSNPATIETAPSGLRIGLMQAAAKGTLSDE